jgi:hypothetical protein
LDGKKAKPTFTGNFNIGISGLCSERLVSSGYKKSIKLLDFVFVPVFWLTSELHDAKKAIPSAKINILDFIYDPIGSANELVE